MNSNRTWETVGRLVETGLLALLTAFLIFFSAFVVPELPAMGARAQRVRAQQIAAENAYYCERLGMKAGTPKYNQCLLDLGEFRQKIENRFADETQLP